MCDQTPTYKCYLCGREINDSNRTEEHVILNAIGGHLKSKTIICKDCNSKMGEQADAKLAEDLSFFTDMLQIRRNRKSNHSQIMKDKDGHEIIVDSAGKKLTLRRPYKTVEEDNDSKRIHLTARNTQELRGMANSLVKDGTITQQQADDIVTKRKVEDHSSPLHKTMCISQEAFPSIIKSAVNFYVDRTHDIDTIKHLVPVIKGEESTDGCIYLHVFKEFPYPTDRYEAVHMIHIEGHKDTGLLYALMEYYSLYTYIVILNDKYEGELNMTYAYDTVKSAEITREFSIPLTLAEVKAFKQMPHEEYCRDYLPLVQSRADGLMNIWQTKVYQEELHGVIDKAFAKFPDGCIFTKEMLDCVLNDIMTWVEKKVMKNFEDESNYRY